MGVADHKATAAKVSTVECAVLTISDSRSEAEDESGRLIQEQLKEAGHAVTFYRLLRNDVTAIQAEVMRLLEAGVHCIICTGGTGLSRRDVTIEAVTPLLDKVVDGFGELFRQFSYQEVGSAALMSRALAGTSRATVIIALPGSREAVRLALERLILPELKHLVWVARG